MDDDFNTGLATGAMFDLAKAINIYGTAVDGGLSVDHEAVEKTYTALKRLWTSWEFLKRYGKRRILRMTNLIMI